MGTNTDRIITAANAGLAPLPLKYELKRVCSYKTLSWLTSYPS